ncbi:MAG: pilus assembly protein PilM [Chitinispirillia bacterium]|nr:pilus assembly protein PilM [Chitinispirillia bacterium]
MAKSAGTNGIDIQRNYICVAQYSARDVAIRHVAVRPLPVSADIVSGSGTGAFWSAVAAELRGIRRKVPFSRRNIVCSLPCDMAVARALEAESDESDQRSALCWELGAGLPGPVDEYAYDFYEVDPGNQVERRRYIAAAVRSESLARLKKAMKEVGLKPRIIDLDLFALTVVFQSNYRERLGEASILVHGELRRTKLILVYNSSYVAHSIVDFDTEGVEVEQYAVMLRDEAARLMAIGAEQNGIANDGDGAKVYLAGSLFSDTDFAAALMAALPGSEMLDPFRKVACAAPMEDEDKARYSPQLAVAVGLALRGDEAI